MNHNRKAGISHLLSPDENQNGDILRMLIRKTETFGFRPQTSAADLELFERKPRVVKIRSVPATIRLWRDTLGPSQLCHVAPRRRPE